MEQEMKEVVELFMMKSEKKSRRDLLGKTKRKKTLKTEKTMAS